jgi:iron complex outermembrane receptor protein
MKPSRSSKLPQRQQALWKCQLWTLLPAALTTLPMSALAQTTATPQVVITGTLNKPGSAGSAEDAYRVGAPAALGPMGSVRLLDTPNSIMVLPKDLIENAQISSVKDALKYLPLVQFQEQQGSEVLRPGTRGMQSSNFQNARFDGMTFFVTGANAMEQLQQIEVLSGPASAAYGPANPAGMFNFIAKRPTKAALRRVTVGYASDAIYSVAADLGGPVGTSDVVSFRLNAAAANGRAFVADSQLDRNVGSLAIDIRPSASTALEFNASVNSLSQKGYPGWFTYGPTINLPTAPDPKAQGLGQSYAGVDLQNKLASVRLKQDLGAQWHLVVGALTQNIDRNINTPVNNLTDNAGKYTASLANGFAPRFLITSNTLYLNGAFSTGFIGHDLTMGTTGFRASTYAVLNTPTAANVLLGTANIANPTVFAQPAAGLPDTGAQFKSSNAEQQGFNVTDTLTLSPQWRLRLAVSRDWMRTRNTARTGALTSTYSDNGWSPMPSLIYKPAENLTTYVTYANSLQQGDLAPAGSANANTGLAPYRSKQFEGGVKLALNRLDLALALFRLERPFASVDAADNVFKISGRQINSGIEATAVGEILPNLTLYGGLTVLDPKMKDTGVPATSNQQYVGMPKLRSNLLFEYRVPTLGGLVLTADWQHVGTRPANDSNTTWAPSYELFDLGARYATQVLGQAVTLRLAVSNVTDKRYWSTVAPSNITGTNKGNMVAHVGAPRTLALSAAVDF